LVSLHQQNVFRLYFICIVIFSPLFNIHISWSNINDFMTFNWILRHLVYHTQIKLWVWTLWGVLDTTLCNKVCQWIVAGQWFSPKTPLSSTNKTGPHHIIEILLKVVLNTMTTTAPLKITQCNLILKKMIHVYIYFLYLWNLYLYYSTQTIIHSHHYLIFIYLDQI
jgi:hypothetical protein